MPSLGPLGAFHPIVVHFVIAFLPLGVLLRWLSLRGRPAFAAPAALLLLLLGTGASVAAVKSGDDAHGPVERIPGAREAVEDHEAWGKRTRNVFLAVAVLELVAAVLARRGKARQVYMASGVLGLAGLVCLYEASEHGGAIVYSHAGGVGIRTGDPKDVERLLLAGLYHQAREDRRSGRLAEAAALVETAVRRFPADLEVRLLRAESLLLDRKDPPAALDFLRLTTIPREQARLRLSHAFLTADALEASGQREGARALLQSLRSEFPENEPLRRRLEQPGGAAQSPSP